MKWVALTLITVLMLLAGLYLSGRVTLWMINVPQDQMYWNIYFNYLKALYDQNPAIMEAARHIKISGLIGFALPVVLYVFGLVILLRPSKKALHGDARFASNSDLAKHGLFKKSSRGVIVGKYRGKLVRLNGQQFVILAAPTRSGKGIGVVIPNLLDYQESAVVLDIKQENFNITSGWRASQGQEIYLFNPFAEDRRTHRWNPLSYISEDMAFRISDLMSIAAMLYPDTTEDQRFWVSQARNAFMAFALYLFENCDDEKRSGLPTATPTLGDIYRISTGDGSDLREYLIRLSSRSFLSSDAKAAFANLTSQVEETFASIIGSFKEPLNPWLNPVLDAATSANDFDLNDIRKKKMTIYIGIQPNKLAESRLIVNLFFSQLINQNTKELPSANPKLKYQCLLLMDEFTAIGRVEIISSAVAYMAGYNLRLLPIIQSMSQLDAIYGKEVSRTIITNHALQIVYAPREQRDANDYSEMLGYTTIKRRNITRGREVTRSISEERRALMLPQELKALGFKKQVFFYEGIPHPVLCTKIQYYKQWYFKRRVKPAVKIPEILI